MDRLLFGDNQFFGVNHMSEEKARSQAMRFQDNQAIIDVLDIALDEGIKTFMCTTHALDSNKHNTLLHLSAKVPILLFLNIGT